MNTTVYQLVKTKKDNTEKIVLETNASSVERAMDYFYTSKPKAYYDLRYRITIKKREPEFVNW